MENEYVILKCCIVHNTSSSSTSYEYVVVVCPFAYGKQEKIQYSIF